MRLLLPIGPSQGRCSVAPGSSLGGGRTSHVAARFSPGATLDKRTQAGGGSLRGGGHGSGRGSGGSGGGGGGSGGGGGGRGGSGGSRGRWEVRIPCASLAVCASMLMQIDCM